MGNTLCRSTFHPSLEATHFALQGVASRLGFIQDLFSFSFSFPVLPRILLMAAKQGLSLVQYIALRGDLMKGTEKWPVGAIVAQACHASTAVLHLYRDDPNVVDYFSDIDLMHKVVLEVGIHYAKIPSMETTSEKKRCS